MIISRVCCSTGLFPAAFETSFGGVLRVLAACNPGIVGETLSCGTEKENFQTSSNELLISVFIVPVRSPGITSEHSIKQPINPCRTGWEWCYFPHRGWRGFNWESNRARS